MFGGLKAETEISEYAGTRGRANVRWPAHLAADWLRWRWGLPLVALATLLRVAWVLAVPTVPVGDFATYRESANYLLEFGRFDPGFIYMPGFVFMLAAVAWLGGELVAQKMIGALLGSLAAAAIFGITDRLADQDLTDPSAPRSRLCPCPTAVIATLLYALWPAGVALSSVVGTDVPAASLMLLAIWALIALADRRPVAAAIAFGVLMGLAAYVRAVALPLTLMAAGYWILRRRWPGARWRWPRVAALTLVSTAATLLVMLPWAVHNRRQHGAFSFSDQHGGITALIGANPNSEGTYSRALNRMFKDLTGRSVISEPHHETDQLALNLAKDWTRFEPAYALGLLVLKAERLFWPESRLLYWPIGRPGVLVGPSQRWFAAHAGAADDLADRFWYALLALFAAGLALAVAERRWLLLSLLPFQLALAATYTIFFAEPRYRVPIQMLAFPFAALALQRGWSMLFGLARDRSRAQLVRVATRLGLAVGAAIALFVVPPAISDAGARLRADHRWAATVWTIDGQPALAKWRRRGPAAGPSPIAGAPNGVHLTLGRDGRALAEVLVAALPAGAYHLDGEIERDAASGPAPGLRFTLAEAARGEPLADPVALPPALASRVAVHARFSHSGGPLRVLAQLEGGPTLGRETAAASIWISNLTVTLIRD